MSRAISFFTYQKIRLRFPADYPITDYLAAADRLTPADFDDPDNEKYMAFRGGCYADFLPGWFDVLGTDHVRVIDFAPARRRSGRPRCTRPPRGSDSTRRASPPTRSAPRTAPPGSRTRGSSASRSPATTSSSACCAATRSSSASCARSTTASTGVPTEERIPDAVRAELAARYEEPNARLAQQLDDAGIAAPRLARAFHLRAFRRHRRRVVAPPSTPVRTIGVSATNTSAHSNTSAITAGIATPESLSA